MQAQSIERFIWQNRDRFYRLAYAYVHNDADALDIVSASIVKALEHKGGLQDGQAIKTWFYRIVVNTAIDSIRKRKRVIYLDDLRTPDPSAADRYADSDLQRALARLPDAYRMTVILRYFEDLPIEEVAAVQKMNVNTAKSRLYKALELLKTDLAPDQPIVAGGHVHG